MRAENPNDWLIIRLCENLWLCKRDLPCDLSDVELCYYRSLKGARKAKDRVLAKGLYVDSYLGIYVYNGTPKQFRLERIE